MASLLPYFLYLLNSPIMGVDVPGQNFGLGLIDDDFAIPSNMLRFPWRNLASCGPGSFGVVSNENEFRVNLDVQQFKPEELKVKVENGYLVIDGEHEEKSDKHGFISRKFTRRYKIPQNVEVEALKSNLTSDGVLSLAAPKKKGIEDNGRAIPITFVDGPAGIKDESNKDQTKTGQTTKDESMKEEDKDDDIKIETMVEEN